MASARDAGAPAPPSSAPSRTAALALFGLVAAGIGAAWLLAWRAAERSVRDARAREVGAVVALKVEQVVRWREERLADAQTLSHDPRVAGALLGPSRAAARRDLETWLEQVRRVGDYTGVALVDSGGRIVSAVGSFEPGHAPVPALVQRATAERRAAMSDVHGSAREAPHVDVVAPVAAQGGHGPPPGVVLLRVDPRPYLFRIAASWQEPSRSAEILLLRPEAGGAVALDAPRTGGEVARFRAGGAIADAVARRRRLPIQAPDHRGVPVIGAVAPVPDAPWSVLAKEDAADTLAPLRERAVGIGIAALGLLVAAGAVVAYAARRQEDRLALAAAERSALARRLARLTAHAQDMVFLADERQRLVEANDRAVQLLGYAREELIGMEVRALRDPATVDDHADRVRQQVSEGAAMFETRYRRKDGSTFPVAVSVHADEVDGRRWFEAIARDISDRERAEEALRESEAKFRAAFEFASLGVALMDAQGRLLETNRALRDISGFSGGELRGASIGLLHDPADPATPDALLARLRGEPGRLELPRRLRRKDGTFAETIVRASALRDEGGRVRFLLAVVEDVSEKRRLEAQLLLADRMASVGTLAAGVAHEINNPLSFILSNLDFAVDELRRSGADPEVLRALGDARDGGARVREIVRDLKTFARPGDDVREALDVRAVLQSAVGLASNEIRHRAQLVVEPGDVPRVAASEHRLAQVLVNLLINAAQAIPEGRAQDNVVRAATSTAPDGRAVVEISDTGVGIAPELLPRIFDPFFTTKPPGVGTGLGLSVCHGIVTQLGGEISVESTPGRGSTFRVALPPAGRVAAAAPLPAASAAPRRARILVVDDEPLVGRAVARMLAAQHDVVVRVSARDALAELLGAGGYDLVLCDLMMPDMTGMELHARLAREAPALAGLLVFLTGGAFTPDARDFLARVPNVRLEKPISPEALRAAVASALGGAAPSAAAGT
ncbi:MAG TPA: PAS domain S-box protein [Anaeromyxobacter sp.]|nr:PAS domain S-box protein [Anaeromyxobacter sp.]